MSQRRLILASTSPYRRELLGRLRIAFDARPPGTDESARAGEAPRDTALRLAREKSAALQAADPEAVVIGSDQVAALGELRLGKPGGRDRAIAQLEQASGRTVEFHTAVCVGCAATGRQEAGVDTTRVRFRVLTRSAIERYVDAEQPFDCAGSAKAEALGIALVECIESSDPTALIGLPLILVTTALTAHGFVLP
ncbi:MAG: Maf family nucleotide pyrophosphatase [Chloroflexaceae bacterium]|jgi:septum formation protein|nr:Maf family nucleotide pyrophosphatase [Chloroflexaceae bacterium]